MTKDFLMGYPPAAARAEVNTRPDPFSFIDERPYPLGIPQRVFAATHKHLCALDEAEEAKARVIEWFETGDHKENGLIAEGVSDAEIIRDVRHLSMQLNTRRAVFEYFQALTERLERVRTRALVDTIRKLWAQRTQEVAKEEKEAQKKERPVLAAYVPPVDAAMQEPKVSAFGAVMGSAPPRGWVYQPNVSLFDLPGQNVPNRPVEFLGMNKTLRDKLANEREQAVNAYLDQKPGGIVFTTDGVQRGVVGA